ncbi:hypothetical protein CERZMDRAFT_9549, partial [Cercospora zeae-maydis SCOH1-5]
MSKRKREAAEQEDADAEDPTARCFRRQRQIMATFAQSAQPLEQALRLARGFERQKLGRRKKAARRDEHIAARIDAEVAALKSLDLTRCAQNVLAKALLKIKAVREAPHLPTPIRTPSPVSTEAAGLNVYARLCSSNPVKAALPTAAAAMKREMGVEEARHSRMNHEHLIDGDEDDHDDHDSFSSDGHESASAGSNVDVDDLERQLEQEGVARTSSSARRPRCDGVFSDPPSDAVSASESGSPHHDSRTAPNKLFLPKLTMTGYVSGSGSEVDEDVETVKLKKNRRGQRARQAIWEKKYGKKAKHVQEQAAKQEWDAKRGAVSTSKFARDANKLPLGKRGPPALTTNILAPSKKPQRDDTGPLHPSWEAAKRAKEKNSATVAFRGKR